MTETVATAEEPFLVKDSAIINYCMSILFFGMFVFAIFTLISGTYVQLGDYRYIFLITLVPALYFLGSAIHNKPFLEITETGIIYRGNVITAWDNFVNAEMILQDNPGSLSDDMRLVVQYYVPEKGMQFMIKLKMSATMDKSEDQIIEAIRSFLEKRNLQ